MNVSVYLNKRELTFLSEVGLELGVGMTATIKAILNAFMKEHENDDPKQTASYLSEFLTMTSKMKSYEVTGKLPGSAR